MNLQNKKVLVTGADGFIGSHLTEALVHRGCRVRAFVYYNSFNSWGWLEESDPKISREIEIFQGDIRDPFGVKTALNGCDVVFHLAALIAIPFSYHSPHAYVDTNIKGSLNVVQAARELEIEKVVHTSTSEVYGTAKYVPIDEHHPLQGQSPYSASKIGADQIALSFQRSFETPVAVIRPFNTYGPRQSARAVIPTIITQIASGIKVLKLGALTPTRDFSFIEDTVAGFIAVAECDQSIGEVINIGSSFEISIGETADLISEILNARIEIQSDEERIRPKDSEVMRLFADNRKALKLTGWQPAYAGREGFKRGLAKTAEWFIKPSNLERYKSDIYNL